MKKKAESQLLRLYDPHDKQHEAHMMRERFRVIGFGRQSGKSTWANNELLRHAWKYPQTNYWFVAPTFKQAKVQYTRMKQALNHTPGLWHKNDTDLKVTLKTGSTISYQSGEVYDNLRGDTLHGVVMDEVRDQPRHLWPLVIRPMLGTTKGWGAFISTPGGFDHFYDLSMKARTDKDWGYIKAPSTCNPLFTMEEYEAAKKDMTEAEFAQEILAEFINLTQGRAYPCFSYERHVHQTPPWVVDGNGFNPFKPIELYMDFNVHFLSWTYGQYHDGLGHFFRGEIRMDGSTQDGIDEFITRFKLFGMRSEIGVILVGDATGNANKTSAVGKTDYTIIAKALKDANIKFRNLTPDSNPPVKDRVQLVNTRLKAADGHQEIFIHPDCKFLIKDFERTLWKENSLSAVLDQIKDKSLTHSSDGVGYGICVRNPINFKDSVGILRRIQKGG